MANIFSNNGTNQPGTESQVLAQKYNSARSNLLLVLAFTVINIILLVANANTYFLFSAFIPYFFVDLGMFFCGKYPSELYSTYYPGMEFLDDSFLVVTLVIAFVILLMYLLSWIFSKKPRVGWLIFALVWFTLDTVAMLLLNGIAIENILDIVFHGWVIFSLVNGIIAYNKLKKLPVEEPVEAQIMEPEANMEAVPGDDAE